MTMSTFPEHHLTPTPPKIIITLSFPWTVLTCSMNLNLSAKDELHSPKRTCVGDPPPEVRWLAHYQMQTQTSGCQIWSLACFALLSYLQNML